MYIQHAPSITKCRQQNAKCKRQDKTITLTLKTTNEKNTNNNS